MTKQAKNSNSIILQKIAIVTPVKNERDNLPKLVASIEAQKVSIFLWVIIENDSDDGSKEFLSELSKLNNVDNLIILNLPFKDQQYQLGKKYATIIKHGFDYIQNSNLLNDIKYIGILDADCHPMPDYYEILLNHFKNNQSLGITSGTIRYNDNTIEKSNLDHARGGCRLWRKQCFLQCPYEIGMSADSISETKAKINGWEVKSYTEAVVYSRKVGSKFTNYYQGLSAYYRCIPFYYIIIKTFYLLFFKWRIKRAYGLFIGYIKAYINGNERIKNRSIAKYYRKIFLRKIGVLR